MAACTSDSTYTETYPAFSVYLADRNGGPSITLQLTKLGLKDDCGVFHRGSLTRL